MGLAGKLYLQIDHQVAPWADDKEVDSLNKNVITAFAEAYPEYKDALAGLIIRAHERGTNRGSGTVDLNKN